jgi:hypothetical protein
VSLEGGWQLSVDTCQLAMGQILPRAGTADPSAPAEAVGRDDKSKGGCQLSVVGRRTRGWQIVASSEEQQVPPLGVNSSVGDDKSWGL